MSRSTPRPRRWAFALTIPTLLLGLGACSDSGGSPELRQTSFRVRGDVEAGLNDDGGWAADEGEEAVVEADAPFRIRFELESEAGAAVEGFGLQARINDGPWEDLVARDFPYPDEISTPRISIVEVAAYRAGAATEDRLTPAAGPFSPGVGVSGDSVAPAWSGDGTQGEWEWPVVIRRYADGAVTNEEGDVVEFRMRVAGGAPIPSDAGAARVRLTIPPGLLGGTFVETPGRLGPWQSWDGTLYFVMEPAETDNVLMVVKSTDGGRSWTEADGEGRPATDDLEGVATAVHEGRIHILHQISESVVHHVFRTSDVPEGEGWEVTDEAVSTPGEPPVQVAALELRPDGSAVAIYGGPLDLRVRIRSPQGAWGDERRIEGDPGEWVSGPQSVLLPDGRVAVAYSTAPSLSPDDEGSADTRPPDGSAAGRLWVRILDPDGRPGPATLVSDRIGAREEESGALAPLTRLEATGEVVLVFREGDGSLWERRLAPGGTLSEPVRVSTRPVAQSAVDSDQVGADAIVHDGVVHVLFIDDASRAIHHTSRLPSGRWTPDEVVVDGIDGQWVRGAVIRGLDGTPVYGFVYDAGSDGGAGMNRYGEIALGPGSG